MRNWCRRRFVWAAPFACDTNHISIVPPILKCITLLILYNETKPKPKELIEILCVAFLCCFCLAIYFSSFRLVAFFSRSRSLSLSHSHFLYRFDENAVQVELNVHKNAEAENQLMAESSKQTNIYQFDGVHTIFRNTLKNESKLMLAHTWTQLQPLCVSFIF